MRSLISGLLFLCMALAAAANPRSSSRAVVVGVSTYQDSLHSVLPEARTNAELFAAFLRSRSGGLLPADLVHLLTDEQATLAQLTTTLALVQEESKPGDEIVLYFSGQARMFSGEKGECPILYFHDSPAAAGDVGTLSLSALLYSLQDYCAKNSISYRIFLDLQMLPQPRLPQQVWPLWMDAFEATYPAAWVVEARGKAGQKETLTRLAIDGALGLADWNGDERVDLKEGFRYLKDGSRFISRGSAFFSAFSEKYGLLSESTPAPSKDPQNAYLTDEYFPSIIGMEVSPSEEALIDQAGGQAQQWYQDFILTIKLGHLLEPRGRCASDLYDSLLTIQTLEPMYNGLRRQLAASLLDETQQALNAYLKTDTRELFRRWNKADQYDKYPGYMARANELIGKKSFLYNHLHTKQHYFEGLAARLDAEKYRDTNYLHMACLSQRRALRYEPQASYVLNELGILHSLLQTDSAMVFFKKAIDYSPTWGIPWSNLALAYLNHGQMDSALYYGKEAVRLAPWNVIAMNTLGMVYGEMGQLDDSEKWISQAIALDVQYVQAQYNLACTKTLQEEYQAALYWLERALQSGFDDWRLIELDTSLSPLREHPDFPALIAKYKR